MCRAKEDVVTRQFDTDMRHGPCFSKFFIHLHFRGTDVAGESERAVASIIRPDLDDRL